MVDLLIVVRINPYEPPRPVAARVHALAPPESGALVASFRLVTKR